MMNGDQVARFVAIHPQEGIREALVNAGWLPPERAERLSDLGVTYLSDAHFQIDLAERIVKVDLRSDSGTWLLRVRAYCRGLTGNQPIPVRRFNRDGTPRPDPAAPYFAYKVALILHEHLAATARQVRWARDRIPLDSDGDVPVAPDLPG